MGKPLDPKKVKTRNQGGANVSYIEGWHAIAEANRIFGFDGWTRNTVETKCVHEAQRKLRNGDGWSVTYTARVRIMVVHEGTEIVRDGSGAGHGIGKDLGECHESALKEAETDAMKRALMTFGNPFGLALYDKEQREVAPPEQDIQGAMVAAINKADSLTKLERIKADPGFKADFNKLSEEGKAVVAKAGTDKANSFAVAA